MSVIPMLKAKQWDVHLFGRPRVMEKLERG